MRETSIKNNKKIFVMRSLQDTIGNKKEPQGNSNYKIFKALIKKKKEKKL